MTQNDVTDPFTQSENISFRFPKSARILTSREFQRVMRNGRRFTSPYFNLLVIVDKQSHTRVGITVSRKIGNAVIRSRVKRVIREFFRLRRPYLQPDIECVIIAKPLAGQTINPVLTKALYGLFSRFNAS